MAFLRSPSENEFRPRLRAGKLNLRMPTMADYAAWAALRARSRDYLTPWEPKWGADELSKVAYKARLRHYEKDFKDQSGYALFMFRDVDNALVGAITLSGIRRGVTQSCSLGYWTGEPYAGLGYMRAGVDCVLEFSFVTLGLHRVEAACLPNNAASIRVLESNGFSREGLARRYLKINGVWQDHLLYARLEDDPGV